MGAPESVHFCPRTSPSVLSMAIVRTVFSPNCKEGEAHQETRANEVDMT
jgi:hypothetical protein